ncbi:hypothetical protein VC83_07532 [Pseudogymnoascus destructans]|uniref:Uncharacterized protein n=1 Tax=Pseudogymnoascus destructans TaxID=655981 RepID=A0A177A4S2_9PEZI|nr:uncharacterized protein VC83_07532 [Pseudogymnoascus destructans]OAF56103.1 hypothetical protein VC83_07532 [Pseudogymnoascus destructans]
MVVSRHFCAVSSAIKTVLAVHLVATRPIILSSITAVTFVQVSINCPRGGSRILTLSSSPIVRIERANLRPSILWISKLVYPRNITSDMVCTIPVRGSRIFNKQIALFQTLNDQCSLVIHIVKAQSFEHLSGISKNMR